MFDPAAIYQGEIRHLPANSASRQLADELFQALADCYPELDDPRDAEGRMAPDVFRQRLRQLQQEVRQGSHWRVRLEALYQELGIDLEDLRYDIPNLKCVPSQPLPDWYYQRYYIAHRDTWSAQPQCQINWWLALHPTPASANFAFYPDYFEQPVANNSDGIDYERMKVFYAFASPEKAALAAPRTTELPADARAERFDMEAGDLIAFSAAQLHQTRPNTSGRLRFSLDFRSCLVSDYQAGRGAPNCDNHSSGSSFVDLLQPEYG